MAEKLSNKTHRLPAMVGLWKWLSCSHYQGLAKRALMIAAREQQSARLLCICMSGWAGACVCMCRGEGRVGLEVPVAVVWKLPVGVFVHQELEAVVLYADPC